MKLVNLYYKKRNLKQKPLKRSSLGLEIELMLLNNKGKVVNEADYIIKKVKKVNENIPVVRECAKNMLEIGCYPDFVALNPIIDLLASIEVTLEEAKKKDLALYCMGCYPGKFDPLMRRNKSYIIKQKIFGEDRFKIAGRCIGFHHHYALPKGVFDEQKKNLKLLINSKLKRSLINSYNFEIAIDPAITLLLQSSPYYQGKYLAKDSRLIVYRGGNKLNYLEGLYAHHQQMGGLSPYKQTATDLLDSIKRRYMRWERSISKVNGKTSINDLYENKLDVTWNPVKLNKHGTLEQRGMDMNYPSIIVGISSLLKFCLQKIQREFIEIVPSDIGIHEPFKFENGIMYIPPHSYVRNIMQRVSAYKGIENRKMREFTKRFFRFAKECTNKSYYKLIQPITNIIDEEKTTSDKILAKTKNKESLTSNEAAELALKLAKPLEKDLEFTKALVENLSVDQL